MGHAEALAWLNDSRTPQGALPWRRDGPAHGEPTLLGVAAGLEPPVGWLQGTELGWPRLLLPAVLAKSAGCEDLRSDALEYILGSSGQTAEETVGTFDGTLAGWSWVDGTFSWVQPTAWALLSLSATGKADHPRAVEGLRMLEDRQGADGGWNYGNPDVLGAELPGYLYLTAWVLLALPAGHPACARGFAFLKGVRDHPSTLNLSVAVLAALQHERDAGPELALLSKRQDPDGGFGGAVDRTALAACAFRTASTATCPLVIRSLR